MRASTNDDKRNLVVIVDEDQAVRDALQFALRLEGFCVHVHSGGAELLADPVLSQAACVVLNHSASKFDGFALLDSLRAVRPDLSAIMLTNHATTRMQIRANAASIATLLEKPLMDNTLTDAIWSVLSKKVEAAPT